MPKKGKLIQGVGVNDVKGSTEPGAPTTYYYTRWHGMLGRAYSSRGYSGITYDGVTVCDSWLVFSNFKSWMISQENIIGDLTNHQLDKDIIIPGNKVYGPTTCRFISQPLNTLLNFQPKRKRSWPLGVSYDAAKHKFKSSIRISGVKKFLGYKETADAAHNSYLQAKIIEIVRQQKLQSDPRIILGLALHILELL